MDKQRVSENTPAFQVTRACYPFSPPPEGRGLGDVKKDTSWPCPHIGKHIHPRPFCSIQTICPSRAAGPSPTHSPTAPLGSEPQRPCDQNTWLQPCEQGNRQRQGQDPGPAQHCACAQRTETSQLQGLSNSCLLPRLPVAHPPQPPFSWHWPGEGRQSPALLRGLGGGGPRRHQNSCGCGACAGGTCRPSYALWAFVLV